MKKNILLSIILIIFVSPVVLSQYFNNEHILYSIGIKNDQLLGQDESKFSPGLGFSLESYLYFKGFSMGIFCVDYYQNKNIVADSELASKFWTFYFFPLDFRFKIYKPESGRLNVYCGLSTAPQMMKLEGTEGTDWSWIIAASVGVQYAYSEKGFIQLQARPYYVIGNQLSKKYGAELKLSVGYMMLK
jgi:hypothetical protein